MRLFIAVFGYLLLSSPVFADTVYMKSGNKVEGKIVERTAESLKIDIHGVVLTYYMDEIERIESADGVWNSSETDQPKQKAAVSPEPVSMSKDELVWKFMEVYGIQEALAKNFELSLKQMQPEYAQKVREAIDLEEAVRQLIPLYGKHFTEDELKSYIDFYSTPAGQKLIRTIPALLPESVTISTQYFQEKLLPILEKAD